MFKLNFAALAAVTALFSGLPATASTWLSASSDSDFEAQNSANAFSTYGTAVIQWGRPDSTNWEVGVKDASGKVLQSGDVPWASVSNLLDPAGSTPLLSYSYLGKTTVTFSTNGVKYAKTGTVTKGADTLWIRGITPPNAYATSVILTGLQIKYTGGTWIDMDYLDAQSNGAYVGFSDPNLVNGFALRYGFGYLNNGTHNGIDDRPSFDFIIGKYASPLAPNIAPSDQSGPAPGADSSTQFSEFGATNPLRLASDPSAVPEPASWAMLIAGFGMVGGTLRRRRPAAA